MILCCGKLISKKCILTISVLQSTDSYICRCFYVKELLAVLHASLFNSETVASRSRIVAPSPLSLPQLLSTIITLPVTSASVEDGIVRQRSESTASSRSSPGFGPQPSPQFRGLSLSADVSADDMAHLFPPASISPAFDTEGDNQHMLMMATASSGSLHAHEVGANIRERARLKRQLRREREARRASESSDDRVRLSIIRAEARVREEAALRALLSTPVMANAEGQPGDGASGLSAAIAPSITHDATTSTLGIGQLDPVAISVSPSFGPSPSPLPSPLPSPHARAAISMAASPIRDLSGAPRGILRPLSRSASVISLPQELTSVLRARAGSEFVVSAAADSDPAATLPTRAAHHRSVSSVSIASTRPGSSGTSKSRERVVGHSRSSSLASVTAALDAEAAMTPIELSVPPRMSSLRKVESNLATMVCDACIMMSVSKRWVFCQFLSRSRRSDSPAAVAVLFVHALKQKFKLVE